MRRIKIQAEPLPPFPIPIFLGFAFYGRCVWVLHLEPIRGAARAVRRVLSLETMPSKPSLQAWPKMVAPSPSMCPFHRIPWPTLVSIDLRVALRTSSGSRRRSSPLFDEVERVEEYVAIIAPIANVVEGCDTIIV